MIFPSTHQDFGHERGEGNWVWMPLWYMEKITEDGREQLRAIGFNL